MPLPSTELLAWTLLLLAASAALGLTILIAGLALVFARAPRLQLAADCQPATSLTVVVPAYNEAANIAACLASLLACAPPCPRWQVLVVDDRSSDATAALAQSTAERLGAGPERFALLDAGPRPTEERWVGKNWACSRAMANVDSAWVLFVDADVRLQPATLQRALGQAISEGADLLSLAPRLSCGCLAEWMVQPIMASLLGLGFPITATNDPADPTAFAAGPFMLFRRSAYGAIGGHAALAGEVVEDLALARRIKAAGLRLRYLLPLQRPVLLTALGIGLLGIALQLVLRLWTRQQFQVPMRHWWLMGAGGLVVAALAPTSVWRTLSGRGWTWKGRALA
jgi:cellulose synthase/poly-beta-1,6-N-acetylglucosamine synthase-like glycosyltransferase